MNSDIETPINLGNPNEFTIIELANKIIDMTGANLEYVINELPVDDPQRRCPDINLAIKHLSWRPRISLDEGLVPTIEWFKRALNDQ